MTDILDSIQSMVDTVRDSLTCQRVFGDPIEVDDATIIEVAKVCGIGGLGGGSGRMATPKADPDSEGGEQSSTKVPDGQGEGGGSGFGLRVRPLGVYRIQGGEVSWQPAIDVNRAIVGAQAVGAIALLATAMTLRVALRRRWSL